MTNKKELIPIVIVLCMVVAAFFAGVCYQKQQPVKIDVISYVNGDVVKTQTFLHSVDMGEITFLSDKNYCWDRNVSFYAIRVTS